MSGHSKWSTIKHKKAAKDGKPGVSLEWFNMLYQVLLGEERGPRFGSFVALYGIANTQALIGKVLDYLWHIALPVTASVVSSSG